MEEKTGKSKKPVLKRKHFILALIAVCAIAVIAEGVLLVVTFSKKKKDKKQDEMRPTVESSEVPEGKQLVWRIAKDTWTNIEGDTSETLYCYDDLGRVVQIETRQMDERGAVEGVVVYRYFYESGSVRIEGYHLEKDESVSEDKWSSVTFVVLPGSTDEFAALTFVNNREGSNFQLEQDEDGRWTRVMVYCNDDGIKYYDEYVFTYDDGKRPTGWNHTEREIRSGQILVPKETVEYHYDEENSPNVKAVWKDPDGTVRQRFFQFGRVAYETTSSVEQDLIIHSRQWVFPNDGFTEEYTFDEDGVLNRIVLRYEIPLSSPSDGRPEDSRKIVLSAETYKERLEYFEYDGEGRVIEVVRRFAEEGAPEAQLDCLQYDDEGRVVSWIHQGIEQTYQYDENGFVSKMIKTGDGEWDGVETFEYIPLTVTAQ